LTKQVTARDVGPITDPAGQSTALPASVYGYTADGYFLATETNPVGHVATTVTDAATGRATAHQAVQGGPWTRMTYDALGRPLSTAVDGGQPAFEVLAVAPAGGDAVITRTVSQAGAPARVELIDRLGRVIATETEGLAAGDHVTAELAYNERGAKRVERAPRAGRYDPLNVSASPYYTAYSGFDALGRVGRKDVVRDPVLFAPGRGDATLVTTYAYDGFKTTIGVGKAAAQGGTLSMSRTYDGRGWLVETTQVDSSAVTIITSYGYDAAGSLTRITDTRSNELTASYDDLGRKVSVTDPDRGTWSYGWDGLGRLRAQTDARGNRLEQEYDAAGRPTLRFTTAPSGPRIVDAEWHYDGGGQTGQLTQVKGTAAGTTGDFQRDYQYDILRRPAKVATRVGARDALMPSGARTFAVEYGYDESYGRLKAKRYPSLTAGGGATVAFDYGARGHPLGETEILASGARGKTYRAVTLLSPRGQVQHQILGNGVDESMTYDASAGLMLSVATTRPVGQPPIRSTHYLYDHFLNLAEQNKTFCRRDAAGACLKKPDGSPDTTASDETFVYDDLQRLTSATLTGAAAGAATYAYDTLGNITAKSDYGNPYLYGSAARALRRAARRAPGDAPGRRAGQLHLRPERQHGEHGARRRRRRRLTFGRVRRHGPGGAGLHRPAAPLSGWGGHHRLRLRPR
jgi:YD repeat-containing protein